MAHTKSQQYSTQQQGDPDERGHITETNAPQIIPIEQQVHLTAGILILIGLALGYAFTSWFYLIPLFVAIGFISSGLSGFCTMSHMLRQMPWNQNQ